jgi:endonuclease YncB( thermonuclease family)
MRFWIPLLAAAIAIPAYVAPVSAESYQATVTGVNDVSHLIVTVNGRLENVKLIGVAPAQFQSINYWQQGRQAAVNMLLNQSVRVDTDVQTRDTQGRLLAWVFVNGVLANEALIRQGAAVAAPDSFNVRYAGNLVSAQQDAARNGAGVWNANNHLPSPTPYPTLSPSWAPTPTPGWSPTPMPTWSPTPKPLATAKPGKGKGEGKKKGHEKGKGHQKGKGKGHDKHNHH